MIEERKAGNNQGKERIKRKRPPQCLHCRNCRELISRMPLAFNPAAADGLKPYTSLRSTGREIHRHLRIDAGPVPIPRVRRIGRISSLRPRRCWLKISRESWTARRPSWKAIQSGRRYEPSSEIEKSFSGRREHQTSDSGLFYGLSGHFTRSA